MNDRWLHVDPAKYLDEKISGAEIEREYNKNT
jgi:hypothetical protein